MAAPAHHPVIVGASVAGALTALRLAQAGVRCSIFEVRNAPHAKVCGEGLHPSGRLAVEEVLGDLASLGQPLRGFRFTDATNDLIAVAHPAPHLGLGCDRLLLEQRLWCELADHPLVRFVRGCAVRALARDSDGWRIETQAGVCQASHVVAADGVRSGVRARTGRSGRRSTGRWGLRLRIQLERPPPADVEICFLDDGEVFFTPLGSNRLSVAVLGDERLVRRLRSPRELSVFLERSRTGRRCVASASESTVQILPHVGQVARPWCRDRLYLVGDAAAFLDPISGAGMTLAAMSARIVARSITSVVMTGADDARAEVEAAREMRRCLRPFRHLTRFLLLLARSPWFRAGAVGALRRSPRLLRAIARPTLQVDGRS